MYEVISNQDKDVAIEKINEIHELLFFAIKDYAIENFDEINDRGIQASICINALVDLALYFQNKFGLPKDTAFQILQFRALQYQNTEKLVS
jgi:hypothetical protein